MTGPRPISPREIALRAEREAESLPHVSLRTHVPRDLEDIGRLPERVSTFRPPVLSLSGLSRDGSAEARPAGHGHGRTRGRTVHHGSFPAPEGIHHFHPETAADRAAIRRTARALLHARPGTAPRHPVATEPVAAPYRPTAADCRTALSEFRAAMSDFSRARYFGGEHRIREASAALHRAEEAYNRLYAILPLTPGMSSILDRLDGQVRETRETLAAITPHRSRRGHA